MIIPYILLELSLLNLFITGFVWWLGEHVVLDYKFCRYRKAAFWRHAMLHAIILFVIYLFVYCYTLHYLTNYFFRPTRSAQLVTTRVNTSQYCADRSVTLYFYYVLVNFRRLHLPYLCRSLAWAWGVALGRIITNMCASFKCPNKLHYIYQILPVLSTITCVWIEWCDRRNSVVVVYCLVC